MDPCIYLHVSHLPNGELVSVNRICRFIVYELSGYILLEEFRLIFDPYHGIDSDVILSLGEINRNRSRCVDEIQIQSVRTLVISFIVRSRQNLYSFRVLFGKYYDHAFSLICTRKVSPNWHISPK